VALLAILSRIARALRPNGVVYMSFKHGDSERIRGDRFFNDINEDLWSAKSTFGPLKLARDARTCDPEPQRSFPLFFRSSLSPLRHCLRTAIAVLTDLGRLVILAAHSRSALAAENLFLRKQLAFFQERRVNRGEQTTRAAGSWQ
jgi:hypothetical protein